MEGVSPVHENACTRRRRVPMLPWLGIIMVYVGVYLYLRHMYPEIDREIRKRDVNDSSLRAMSQLGHYYCSLYIIKDEGAQNILCEHTNCTSSIRMS